MSEEIKVSEMQEAKEINDEDLLMLIQKNANKKVTIKQIKNLFKIIDNLTSDSTTDALSANQGKILNEKITNTNTYSTSETNTGKKWIDGKDIYRKVIELSNIPASTTEYSYNVENIDKIVNAQASWYDTTDKATFVTNLRYDGSGANIKFTYLKDKFKVEVKYDWVERTSDVSVVIEYTKQEA
jgi:hypothetical protein|nr:MAG TPA: hypothetical protein [Caudoviricetes sp.]